ncbi:MAG: alpha-L-fucosidase [Saprospiraceae bacterium]
MFKNLISISLLALLTLQCSSKQEPENTKTGEAVGAMPEFDQTTWASRKYSLFIHWGLYSIPGGIWKGKQIEKGYSEQIQAHANIPSDEYAQLATQFNPTGWDPERIVQLAKDAGMQSIVLTAKHHDGFCMFASDQTDFDVVDATPYGQDVVKGLAEACARGGLKFGLYYSLIDWHHPDGSPISPSNSDPISAGLHAYNLAQVRELLSNYGPIDQLWFDMGAPTPEQSNEYRDLVKSLQPECQISSRVWNQDGDFYVMGDNQYPEVSIDAPWQVPASMFDDTWGYRSWQKRGDPGSKAADKLHSLVRVAGSGGVFLLNIGPDGNGSVVPYEVQVLKKIGNWIRQNGLSIFDAQPTSFGVRTWGAVTKSNEPGKLYVTVLENPQDGFISLYGLQNQILRAYPMHDPSNELPVAKQGKNITINVGSVQPDSLNTSVVIVEYSGDLDFFPLRTILPKAETYTMNLKNAKSYKAYVGDKYQSITEVNDRLQWFLQSTKSGNYAVRLSYTNEEVGRGITLRVGDQTFPLSLEKSEPEEIPAPSGIAFGNFLLAEPIYRDASFSTIHGVLYNLAYSRPWGYDGSRTFREVPEWEQGTPYDLQLPDVGSQYVGFSMFSPTDQIMMTTITADDGVAFWVGGEKLLEKFNPAPSKTYLVEVPLEQGNNQMMFKFYNSKGNSEVTIQHDVVAARYHTTAGNVNLQEGKIVPVEIRAGSAQTDLGFVNFKLEIVPVENL